MNKWRNILLGTGIGFIVLAVVIGGLGLWETFAGIQGKMHQLELPGFHEVDLDSPGMYAGVYQHMGNGPIPSAALSKMNIKLISKSTYQEVPVMVNTTGQTFERFGQQGMLLFNFILQEPGSYSLSGMYLDGQGPTVNVMMFAQQLQNTKQTLVVTALFFTIFLALGITMIVKRNKWVSS